MVLEAGIANYGPPERFLTDNGDQYVTCVSKSQFTAAARATWIRQIVARPTAADVGQDRAVLGHAVAEFLETAVFADLAEAARGSATSSTTTTSSGRTGRGRLVPADRFFQAARPCSQTLKERVAANALNWPGTGSPSAVLCHGPGGRPDLQRASAKASVLVCAGGFKVGKRLS